MGTMQTGQKKCVKLVLHIAHMKCTVVRSPTCVPISAGRNPAPLNVFIACPGLASGLTHLPFSTPSLVPIRTKSWLTKRTVVSPSSWKG